METHKNAFLVWLRGFVIVASSLIVIAFYNLRLARLISWTFFQSETAIGGWMEYGLATTFSTIIGVVGGFVAISHHIWVANQSVPFFNKLWFFKPKEIDTKSRVYVWASKAPYLAIFILTLIPDGGALWAIAAYKLFNLKKSLAISLIHLGNALKNILWGLGFGFLMFFTRKHFGLIIFIVIIISGIPFVYELIKKLRRK